MTEVCRGRKGYTCSRGASFFVTFYIDGTDGRYACGTHLPMAVREITREVGFRASSCTIMVREVK